MFGEYFMFLCCQTAGGNRLTTCVIGELEKHRFHTREDVDSAALLVLLLWVCMLALLAAARTREHMYVFVAEAAQQSSAELQLALLTWMKSLTLTTYAVVVFWALTLSNMAAEPLMTRWAAGSAAHQLGHVFPPVAPD